VSFENLGPVELNLSSPRWTWGLGLGLGGLERSRPSPPPPAVGLIPKFGDKVEVTGEGTPDTTGYLEVEIVGGAVLHTKKGGDGYVDTSDKMNKIFAGVEAALA